MDSALVGQPFWHRGQERSQAGGWEETGGGAQAVTNEKVSTDGEEEGWGPLGSTVCGFSKPWLLFSPFPVAWSWPLSLVTTTLLREQKELDSKGDFRFLATVGGGP